MRGLFTSLSLTILSILFAPFAAATELVKESCPVRGPATRDHEFNDVTFKTIIEETFYADRWSLMLTPRVVQGDNGKPCLVPYTVKDPINQIVEPDKVIIRISTINLIHSEDDYIATHLAEFKKFPSLKNSKPERAIFTDYGFNYVGSGTFDDTYQTYYQNVWVKVRCDEYSINNIKGKPFRNFCEFSSCYVINKNIFEIEFDFLTLYLPYWRQISAAVLDRVNTMTGYWPMPCPHLRS